MEKRNFLLDLKLLLLLLLIIAGIVIVIDPYQRYGNNWFRTVYSADERFLNPGLARHENYDTIILGSSMTRNFSTNQIDLLLNFNSLKLTMMSGTAYDHKIIFDIANKNKKIKNVIYGLDLWAFDREIFQNHVPLEEYLYTENFFYDYKYIYNSNTLFKQLPKVVIANIFSNKYKSYLDKDKAYSWKDGEFIFSKENVLKNWKKEKEKFQKKEINNQEILRKMSKNYEENLKKIILSNPEINFYIFFPPYSILTWKRWLLTGELEGYIQFKSKIMKDLSKIKNVKLYDFQIEEKIILNLDNYLDYSHYHPSINEYMIEQIKENKKKLQEEQINENIEILYNLINKFEL